MNKKILILILVAVVVVIALAVIAQQKAVVSGDEMFTELQESNSDETASEAETQPTEDAEETASSTSASNEEYGNIFLLSAQEGTAPLMVELTPQFMDMKDNWIDFGDGTTAEVSCLEYMPDTDRCTSLTLISHTFDTSGTYTVSFMSGQRSNPAEAEIIASEVVEVE